MTFMYVYIYILLIYSRAILSFAWLVGYAMRPVLFSDAVHTNSFTAHSNNTQCGQLCLHGVLL